MIDRLLILICFAFGSAASLFSLVASRPEVAARSWIEFYFVLLVFSIFGALVYSSFKGQTWREKLRRPELLLWLAVFALALIYRWKFAHQQPVFMDEDYQLDEALNRWPVEAGANQHQPPFEFALQFAIAKIFGFGESIDRASAMVFSSVAVATLAVLGRRLWGLNAIALAAATVFTLHAIVDHYAWEARPISIGLAAAVLILCFFSRFLSREAKLDRREWILGMAACSLAVLSLGLQPAFFLASVFAVTLLLWNRPWGERIWFASQILAALASFLPIQLWIFANAPPRFALNGSIAWEMFDRPFLIFVAPLGVLAFVSLAFLLVFRKFDSLRRPAVFAGVGFFFLIPLVFFFRSFIAYNLNDYYVVFFWLPWVICCFSLVSEALSAAHAKSKPVFAVTAVVLVLSLWTGAGTTALDHYLHYSPARPDFRSATRAAIEKVGTKRAAFFSFCMASENCSCEWGLTGSRAYLAGENLTNIDYPESHTSEWLPQFAHSTRPYEAVALFFNEAEGAMCRSIAPTFFEMLSTHFPNMTVAHFSGVDLIFLEGESARNPRFLGFFEALGMALRSQKRSQWSLLPELIFLNEAAGNREKANTYFREFVTIANFPALQGNRAGIDLDSVFKASRALGLGEAEVAK